MNTEQKQTEVEKFFKEAFSVDGAAELMLNKRELKHAFKIISIVKLTDSKRGEFYIASVRPK